ncbi:5926_t:CDS:2 [Funneliformis mosseae]|uniref:5926_t:CDS:1 n=1 Tax=Funneliformis mosseae TaxID=27381 RepID=A0A9N9FDI2_FUNMO|nr:5926_t:CDS:2 [Funneliformis mosseae]
MIKIKVMMIIPGQAKTSTGCIKFGSYQRIEVEMGYSSYRIASQV